MHIGNLPDPDCPTNYEVHFRQHVRRAKASWSAPQKAKLLTRDEARGIAANITKLLELLRSL
jgi:hypothetical protein